MTCALSLIITSAEHGQKCFLRDFNFAKLLEALLAFFLLVPQFAFAADVAAVAFGGDVFLVGRNRFAGDDLAADGRLQRDLELMLGDLRFELLDDGPSATFGDRAM